MSWRFSEPVPETHTEAMNHWLSRVADDSHTICVLSGRRGRPDTVTLLRNGEELDRMTIYSRRRTRQLIMIAERAMLQQGWIVCSTTKGWLSYNLGFKRKVFSSAPNRAARSEEAEE